MTPYAIVEHKRLGETLTGEEIQEVVRGATDGSWSDAQLAAFLMASAINGLDVEETGWLTQSMLESGEQWHLSRDIPILGDKHSTGGVGDKVSLILAPLLASCGQPTVMLTGRALGHTGGTADKLEGIPGLSLDLGRDRCVELIDKVTMAVGVATPSIAPADRKLYALRDATATVAAISLVTASILSKKLATGAAAIVFDVKTGSGAFFPDLEDGKRLAEGLVKTCGQLGTKAAALVTDMSQPLGDWVGHNSEVLEVLQCLEGRGSQELMEVTYALCGELGELTGVELGAERLREAVSSGAAREAFERWALAQGADATWLRNPTLDLAPVEVVLEAPTSGQVTAVDCKELGLLLAEAGASRARVGSEIDYGVALKYTTRLGCAVSEGDELARVYLRRANEELVGRFKACFHLADSGNVPVLIPERFAQQDSN